MASICWSSVSLLILLAFPFSATLISPLLALVALPYFLAMASDLRYCGYKRLDVFRIYGFNLVLLPVNLAGTLRPLCRGSRRPRPLRPHPEGAQPHRRAAVLRHGTLPGDRAGRRHVVLRVPARPYREHGLRRAQRCAWPVTRSRPSSDCATPWWTRGSMPLRCCTSRPVQCRRLPGKRDRPPVPQSADWRSVLEVGYPESQTRADSPAPGRQGLSGGAGRCTAAQAVRPAVRPGCGPHRRYRLRRAHRRADTACRQGCRPPPDLVRAVCRRHAHSDLPVPEFVSRRGTADGPGVRGRRTPPLVARRAGEPPTRWPRPTSHSPSHRASPKCSRTERSPSCRLAARPTPASMSPAPA